MDGSLFSNPEVVGLNGTELVPADTTVAAPLTSTGSATQTGSMVQPTASPEAKAAHTVLVAAFKYTLESLLLRTPSVDRRHAAQMLLYGMMTVAGLDISGLIQTMVMTAVEEVNQADVEMHAVPVAAVMEEQAPRAAVDQADEEMHNNAPPTRHCLPGTEIAVLTLFFNARLDDGTLKATDPRPMKMLFESLPDEQLVDAKGFECRRLVPGGVARRESALRSLASKRTYFNPGTMRYEHGTEADVRAILGKVLQGKVTKKAKK